MKKLVFVLFAVFMLTACEKNDDNLELTNEGISDVETNVNAFRGGNTQTDPLLEIVNHITIRYEGHTTPSERANIRQAYHISVGLISWTQCFGPDIIEIWEVTPDTKANLIAKTLPLHNEPPVEGDEHIIFDPCN